jgi:hypothetical protein
MLEKTVVDREQARLLRCGTEVAVVKERRRGKIGKCEKGEDEGHEGILGPMSGDGG